MTVLGENPLVSAMSRIKEQARLERAGRSLEAAQVTEAVTRSRGSLRPDHARAFGPRLTHFRHLNQGDKATLLEDMEKALVLVQKGEPGSAPGIGRLGLLCRRPGAAGPP